MRPVMQIIVIFLMCSSAAGFAQIPQTISYQGVLTDGAGTPVADGTYNITFKLYDAASGGSEQWTEMQPVAVAGGIFSIILGADTPLGIAFDRPYWLGVSVDGGAELSPRRELTASPYSLNSQGVADSAITAGMIKNGTAVRSLNSLTDDVTLAAGANVTITQSNDSLIVSAAAGTTATDAWSTNGNAGTSSSTNFLGTTDTEGLTFRVNNEQALYIANNATCPIIVGGYEQNDATAAAGAVIAGGGRDGNPNQVTGDFGVVGGGWGNTAYVDAAVTGGHLNNAVDSCSFVGGGHSNDARGDYSTVCGGWDNETDADYATVGGGSANTADAPYATVPGGYLNYASGEFSFAAGRWAAATNYGCFVWSDSTNAVFQSTAPNQFLIRAKGGVGIGTNSPAAQLDVNGTSRMTGFQLTTAPTAGYVLTSDAAGTGSWQPATGGAAAWSLTGNGGTSVGTNFIGTTDTVPVEIWSGNERALRLEYNVDGPNVVGGHLENRVIDGAAGATIAGGGSGTFDVAAGASSARQLNNENVITDDYGFIGGGLANWVGNDDGDPFNSRMAMVAGGQANTASGAWSSVLGGAVNEAAGEYSAVGGGSYNLAGGESSTVSGGKGNSATEQYAFVGGGQSNDATGTNATVGGGANCDATGDYSFVGGGAINSAAGDYATVPGGQSNHASGDFSFAAGRLASANHNGTFVWADSSQYSFSSTARNQFLIRASGGVGIGTSSPQADLDVYGTARMRGFQLTLGYAAGYVLTSDAAGFGTWQPAAALKNTIVATSSGERRMHAEESAEVWFTDYGFGELSGGVARITFDPTFKETVDLDGRYHVFVQAYGDADLYVTNRTASGFDVRAHDGGPDVEFSYRVVAKRRGFERERMPLAAKTD